MRSRVRSDTTRFSRRCWIVFLTTNELNNFLFCIVRCLAFGDESRFSVEIIAIIASNRKMIQLLLYYHFFFSFLNIVQLNAVWQSLLFIAMAVIPFKSQFQAFINPCFSFLCNSLKYFWMCKRLAITMATIWWTMPFALHTTYPFSRLFHAKFVNLRIIVCFCAGTKKK